MRAVLCLWLLCAGLALAQPNPTLTATATATPTPTPSANTELNEVMKQKPEEDESRPPSAKDTDRPAVFGVMIASRQHEKAGISIATIRRASILPWALSAILLPTYLLIARRRGFRARRSQP